MTLAFTVCVFITLISLGNWQLRRLEWKQDLVADIEARAFAEPVPAPESPVPQYTRLKLEGLFQHDLSLRIKAVTDLGPGSWLMTPLQSASQTVWVNRGFIPTGIDALEISTPANQQEVVGLARLPVPDGTWLEKNKPQKAKWFSADLPVMSSAAGISAQAAYYLDAEAGSNADAWPRGGMTKLVFRNTHLIYAITWYTMALLLLAGVAYILWDGWRNSRLDRKSGPG